MSSNVVELSEVRSVCEQCGIYSLCLPHGLSSGDMGQLDNIITRKRPLKKGEHLYRSTDEFFAVFALRSGSMKAYISNPDGEEHIIGFKMPGDLIGLSGINGKHYVNSVVALETCSLCEIPYDKLEDLSNELPDLQKQLMDAMSKEIQFEYAKSTMCSKLPAEARLASLLLTLSDRFQQRGFSATEFNLSMPRTDIANLLGLAVETISRLFTQYQDNGIVHADRKKVKILDMEKLKKLIVSS